MFEIFNTQTFIRKPQSICIGLYLRWMQIAVSSFRVTTGRCGVTEARFTKITPSVLSWIIKNLSHQGMLKLEID